MQDPVTGSQTKSLQISLGCSQTVAVPPVHVPFWQAAPATHRLDSLQIVPLGLRVKAVVLTLVSQPAQPSGRISPSAKHWPKMRQKPGRRSWTQPRTGSQWLWVQARPSSGQRGASTQTPLGGAVVVVVVVGAVVVVVGAAVVGAAVVGAAVVVGCAVVVGAAVVGAAVVVGADVVVGANVVVGAVVVVVAGTTSCPPEQVPGGRQRELPLG